MKQHPDWDDPDDIKSWAREQVAAALNGLPEIGRAAEMDRLAAKLDGTEGVHGEEFVELLSWFTALVKGLERSPKRSLPGFLAFFTVLLREANVCRSLVAKQSDVWPSNALVDMTVSNAETISGSLMKPGAPWRSMQVSTLFDSMQAMTDSAQELALSTVPHQPEMGGGCGGCRVLSLARRGHSASKIMLAYGLLLATDGNVTMELSPSDVLAEAYLSKTQMSGSDSSRAVSIIRALMEVPKEGALGIAALVEAG